MKRLILALILIATPVMAQQYDITDEARQTINKHRIADILIHNITKQAIVTIQKGYVESGEFISTSEFTVIFMNNEDNPTEYTDFIQAIGIKGAQVKSQIKNKLGI